MDGKRVLVTGANGFIGRCSVPPLRAAGFDVHALLSGRDRRAIPGELDGAELHTADLFDPAAVDAVVSAVQPTHLLHFAWLATPGIYWTSPENYRWLDASRDLLGCFRANGGVRAVMAGSCAEYDWDRESVCREATSVLAGESEGAPPAASYAACKIAMQKHLQAFGRSHGLSTAWGRIFFQFGPNEYRDRLVPSVICKLLSNREALCTHGRQIRAFLHVADVGSAFAALLDSRLEGPVNIGSQERVSIAALVDCIATQIGRSDLVRLGAKAALPGEPAMLVPDVHRLREELGWNPRYSLHEGVADTIAWWRRTGFA
jgi:nucleoside-diphosphate-sugar epimerase